MRAVIRQSSKGDSTCWGVRAFALRAQPMLDAPQRPLHKAGADIVGQKIQGPSSLEGTVGLAEPPSRSGNVADGFLGRGHDAKHHGRYVILYKDTFLGFARSEVAAYRQALKKGLGNRDFYIGHCIYKHEEIPAKIRVKTAPI